MTGRPVAATSSARVRRRAAARGDLVVAAAVVVVLLATSGGYGFHRDELYFLAAGRHLAWGYPDQGPVTPFLARLATLVDATPSPTLLRVPAALAAGGTVLVTGVLAGELGADRRGRTLAAAVVGVSVFPLFVGHTLGTSTVDLLAWTVLTWLLLRAVRDGGPRWWLPLGAVLGVALLNKPLPAVLAVAVLVALVAVGPRTVLRGPWPWVAALLALVLWSPWLLWQAGHGWPQLDVARAIAGGGSASSQPWWAVVPFQVLLVGPVLAPVWVTGLVRLARTPSLRFLALTWGLLAVAFTATGGKPYYLAGLLPLLVAAGAGPVVDWVSGRRARRGLVAAALALSTVAGLVLALPVLPARDAGPVVAVNADVGETIGWPDLVRTVAGVVRDLPADPAPVVYTENYGEAGAVDRFGPALGLPHAVSGHNGYGTWGPPPDTGAPVVAVGVPPDVLAAHFAGCTVRTHVHDAAGIDNDEDGAAVAVCRGPRGSWSRQWPALRRLG